MQKFVAKLGSEVKREDYMDYRYKQLMKTNRGRKLVEIMKLLTKGVMTVKELNSKTGFSESEVKELIKKGVQKGYIAKTQIPRSPGRPKAIRSDIERMMIRGRRPNYFHLTGDGLWIIRFDPEVRDRWPDIERRYEDLAGHSLYHSYANLLYAIRKHPKLRKHQKPYYFMDGELQRTALNPFLWTDRREEDEVVKLYDDLVKVIKDNVRPQFILNYYITLEESAQRLERVLKRHRLLMEKMKKLPEVQEYLKREHELDSNF